MSASQSERYMRWSQSQKGRDLGPPAHSSIAHRPHSGVSWVSSLCLEPCPHRAHRSASVGSPGWTPFPAAPTKHLRQGFLQTGLQGGLSREKEVVCTMPWTQGLSVEHQGKGWVGEKQAWGPGLEAFNLG